MLDRDRLEEQLSELPLYVYFFVKTNELTFSERVRYICETECPMYAKTWACPPGTGTVDKCREKCMLFDDALLIATITEVQDISNIEQTLATRSEHEEVTAKVKKLVQEQTDEVFVLSSEACSICEECTYPHEQCRCPEIMNPCIESHGIVLSELAERYGVEFQYGSNVVTWFSLLFYK